jgi:signal transduction histidine kinase
LKRFVKSLRFRLFVLIFICVMGPSICFGAFMLPIDEQRSIDSNVTRMMSQAQVITNQIASTGYLDNQSVDFLNAELVALSNAYSGRIMVIDSSLRVVKDTYDIDAGRYIIWDNVVAAAKGQSQYYHDEYNKCITVTIPILSLSNSEELNKDDQDTPADNSGVIGVLLLTRSTEDIDQESEFQRNFFGEMLLIAGILAVAVALFFSNRYTHPFRLFKRRIHNLKENGTEYEWKEFFTEDKEISDEFDNYRERAVAMEDARQAFVSNVSHELKTPLASIKVLADSLNGSEGAPIEMYKEFMEDITDEIDRETNVINDLLSLVRMDRSGATLNITSVQMNDMIEDLLRRLKPLAEKQEVELVLESFRPVVCEVDEVKFSLALMNLVENGIKYNHEGGFVHVTLNADKQYCFIRVEDSGIGIPEDSVGHIFERFYRVDKSHSREIGGTGLGLAIVSDVIALHRGEIKVSSVLGEGSFFDIRIPLKYMIGGTGDEA